MRQVLLPVLVICVCFSCGGKKGIDPKTLTGYTGQAREVAGEQDDNRSSVYQREYDVVLRGKVPRITDFFKKKENNLVEDSWVSPDVVFFGNLGAYSKDSEKETEVAGLIEKMRNAAADEKPALRKRIIALLDSGASPTIACTNRRGNGSLLHACIDLEELELLDYALKKGAVVDIGGENNITPLAFLFECGISDIAYYQLLLKYGADPNIMNNYGRGSTLLTQAAVRDYYEVADLLLDYGADINERNDALGNTALTLSYFHETADATYDSTALLLARGAEYTDENDTAYTVRGMTDAPFTGTDTYEFSVPKNIVNRFRDPKKNEAVIRSYFYRDFVKDENNYYLHHPVKIFDDNPATSWAVSRDTAAGSSIGIVFDRTVTFTDLGIIPCYYDKLLMKKSYGIKTLTVRIGNETIDFSFADEFRMQRAQMKKQYSCNEIEFIIKDIHESNATANDVAIAEIEFINDGNKVTLYLSKSKKYLRKITPAELIVETAEEVFKEYGETGIANKDDIPAKKKLTPELFSHFLAYCGIPENSMTWNDADKNGTAEINEIAALNMEHVKKLWKYAMQISSDNGFSTDDYHYEIMQMVREGKAERYTYLLDTDVYHGYTLNGRTSISTAAEAGSIELLKFFHSWGGDINLPDSETMRTPLFYAIDKNNIDAAKWLVEKGAKINIIDMQSITPLMLAADKASPELALYLIEKGANIDVKDDKKQNLLFHAARAGNLDLVKLFAGKGIDKNEVDASGNNAAMATHSEDIALYLLENGSDYRIRNTEQKSLLEIAIIAGWEKVVAVLCDKNDIDLNGGDTSDAPLFYAVENERTEMVKLLIAKGADVKKAESKGRSLLQFTVINLNIEMAKILISAGACANCPNDYGASPANMLFNIMEEYKAYFYENNIYFENNVYGINFSSYNIDKAEELYALLESAAMEQEIEAGTRD